MIRPPTPATLDEAARLLRADRLVAFPTETVYGLGANALSSGAVAAIYQAKGRPVTNPLIVHVGAVAAARGLCADWSPIADRLAADFWPGPLTLVLSRGVSLAPEIAAGRSTVAVRVPAHPVALALLDACGLPLAAPSANRSESVSPTTAEHVARADLPGLGLIIDGGPCRRGIESSVVDLTVDPPRLLRPGALPLATLREALPGLQYRPGQAAGPSPGLMRRHYAPSARLIAADDPFALDPDEFPGPVAALIWGGGPIPVRWVARIIESLPGDPIGFAAGWYAALHRLDAAGVATVLVRRLPESEEWAALRDRLDRATEPA